MKRAFRTLLVVLVAIMSFFVVEAVSADEITVTGKIQEADRDMSLIVIAPEEGGDPILIIGFPFHNLELQLDEVLDPLDPELDQITIREDDCVSVTYSEKELNSDEVVNKWEKLTMYCEQCTTFESCFGDFQEWEREPQGMQKTNNK